MDVAGYKAQGLGLGKGLLGGSRRLGLEQHWGGRRANCHRGVVPLAGADFDLILAGRQVVGCLEGEPLRLVGNNFVYADAGQRD